MITLVGLGNMKILNANLPGILIIEPSVYSDERGFFLESWNKRVFDKIAGRSINFCQDNHSQSFQNVLRGLHYQYKNPQCKLVRVVKGSVLDVVVDIRKTSLTFGKHFKILLSEKNQKQLWIPEGFAHGFLTLSEKVDFLYKADKYYDPSDEECILWNDPYLNINWELNGKNPNVSLKDSDGKLFKEAKVFK